MAQRLVETHGIIKGFDGLEHAQAGRKNGGTHSILDLEGLGKEIWEGVDADKYVAEERDS